MQAFWLDASTFLLRWLHVVAAIAWIGESFYFVALDRGLKPPAEGVAGIGGESWSVHGGGFYRKQKFAVAPAELPTDLHWSMWKSYTTWLSGFALLCFLYFSAPGAWLIDPEVAALDGVTAILAALGLLLATWVGYDLLCRLIGFRDNALGLAVALLVAAVAYAATHLFAGRAAFLLTGAALATVMSANVFFVIIPGQRKMVAELRRGVTPDPTPGRRGKQRSVHNTYFTLPVVFAMLSTHFAPVWAAEQRWLVLLALFAAAAAIRQFFVVWHSGERAWGLLAFGAVLLFGTLALLAPREVATPASTTAAPTAAPPVADGPAIASPEALGIVASHCAQCHSAHPTLMPTAPNGARFDSVAEIESRRAAIARQLTLKVMPPGNLTHLSDEDRARLIRWAATTPPAAASATNP
jgi:uncharacterized membrane protein